MSAAQVSRPVMNRVAMKRPAVSRAMVTAQLTVFSIALQRHPTLIKQEPQLPTMGSKCPNPQETITSWRPMVAQEA